MTQTARQYLGTARPTDPRLLAQLREGISGRLGFRPHPTQDAILSDRSRFQVFAGGRRVGKSRTGGSKLLPYAFSALAEKDWLERMDARREYWIVGPEYSDSEKEFRVLYNGLRRLGVPFDRPGTYYNAISGDMHISLWNGLYQVHAKSAKYPGTLVGEGVSGVVFSEAAKIKPSVWIKFVRPTLADFAGWAFFGSTPEGRNWFHDLYNVGQDSAYGDWVSWRIPSWDNPYIDGYTCEGDVRAALRGFWDRRKRHAVPPEPATDWKDWAISLGLGHEIASLLVSLSEEAFRQEIGAEFNEFVGRVFKNFDEDLHVADLHFDTAWKTYAAIDYGFTNPFVWLLIQIDPFDRNIRVLREYYERGRTNAEAMEEIAGRGMIPEALREFFPDPAEPDRTREIEKKYRLRGRGSTGGELNDRLEWIRRALNPASELSHLDVDHRDWVPRLQIDRSCTNFIREMNLYRYPATAEEAAQRGRNAPELPMPRDNHCPEAFGRFMRGYFGSPWDERGTARQTTARVTARRPVRGTR